MHMPTLRRGHPVALSRPALADRRQVVKEVVAADLHPQGLLSAAGLPGFRPRWEPSVACTEGSTAPLQVGLSLGRADIFPARLEHGSGKSVVARWLILRAGEFGPQDADRIGGLESEPHPVPSDPDHGQGDVDADDELLAWLPAENQHGTLP